MDKDQLISTVNKESPVKIIAIEEVSTHNGCGSPNAPNFLRVIIENASKEPLRAGFMVLHRNGCLSFNTSKHQTDSFWPGDRMTIAIHKQFKNDRPELLEFFVLKDDELCVPDDYGKVYALRLDFPILTSPECRMFFERTPYFCADYILG